MSDLVERLVERTYTEQEIFLLSLPLELRQRFLSDKHVEMPKVFSNVLIVDTVEQSVRLCALNAHGGLTWHRDAGPIESTLDQIRAVLSKLAEDIAESSDVEGLAQIAVKQLSQAIGTETPGITGEVELWFFEKGNFADKRLRKVPVL